MEVVHVDGDDVPLSGSLRFGMGRLKNDDLCLFQRVRPAEVHRVRSCNRRLGDNDAVEVGLPIHIACATLAVNGLLLRSALVANDAGLLYRLVPMMVRGIGRGGPTRGVRGHYAWRMERYAWEMPHWR